MLKSSGQYFRATSVLTDRITLRLRTFYSTCLNNHSYSVRLSPLAALSMKLDTLFSALLLLSALFCSVESWRRRRRRRCYRNCTPQSWAPWSTCSRSCGTGTQTRRRGIAVAAICGGTCNVALQETKLCVRHNVNCGWSWNSWAPCSATCGMSTQARTMRITQRPICGGTACPTIQIQTRSCNTGA